MSDIQKTLLICELYKQKDSQFVEEYKIPSLANDLQSKTLMKLIGFYRDKMVPIDVIALIYDLEKQSFSLFRLIWKLMKFSQSIEKKLDGDIANRNSEKKIDYEINFRSSESNNQKTNIRVQICNNDSQQLLLQEINKKCKLDIDEIVLMIDLRCNSTQQAQAMKTDILQLLELTIQSIKDLLKDPKLTQMFDMLKIETDCKGDTVQLILRFHYPAIQPVITRFRLYVAKIIGQQNNIDFDFNLDSNYDFNDVKKKNLFQFFFDFMNNPQTDFNLKFNCSHLPSIIFDYLQHLKQKLAKKIGEQFKDDKKYKYFIKDQAYQYFMLGMTKLKLNFEYKKRLYSSQQEFDELYKQHKKVFFQFFSKLEGFFDFLESGLVKGFVCNINLLDSLLNMLHFNCLSEFKVYLNLCSFTFKFSFRSKGLKELASKYMDF